MMYVSFTEHCCNVLEIQDLRDTADGTPEKAIQDIKKQVFYAGKPKAGTVVFTELVKAPADDLDENNDPVITSGYGRKLAACIRKYKLGRIISARPVLNPGHDHHWTKTYVWTPDFDRLKAFSRLG